MRDRGGGERTRPPARNCRCDRLTVETKTGSLSSGYIQTFWVALGYPKRTVQHVLCEICGGKAQG